MTRKVVVIIILVLFLCLFSVGFKPSGRARTTSPTVTQEYIDKPNTEKVRNKHRIHEWKQVIPTQIYEFPTEIPAYP
jgi:hypothetical protein